MNGKIFIVTNRPVNTSGIVIEIIGKEKNKFTRFWEERQQFAPSEKGKRAPVKVIRHAETLKQRNDFIYVEQKLASCNVLVPGAHCGGFTFTLPTGIPSSFFFRDDAHDEKPKAKAKYLIKVSLEGTNISAKRALLVRPVAPKVKDST